MLNLFLSVEQLELHVPEISYLPLARQSQPERHMQITWIGMRCQVTRCLIFNQAVLHPANVFNSFEQH